MARGRVLVIAGSDSSGGAGLEADQKVIAAHDCYAMTATTALTAQNTLGVHDVHQVPPDFVVKQIDACVEDIGVDVVKTGMLASAETVEAVARALERHGIEKVVIDPVMVSTSGAELLTTDAAQTLKDVLLTRATVLTPNVPEAQLLLSLGGLEPIDVESAVDLERMAKSVQTLGPQWVLMKGGHVPFRSDLTKAEAEDERKVVVDVLYGHGQAVHLQSEYSPSKNTHGTGCSLASAIASNLAIGLGMPAAVKAACRYVAAGIKTAPGIGKGHGPLNHFHSVYRLPFAPGGFVEYLLERPDVAPHWDKYTKHPFVLALGNGTLPIESFKGYLVQDYLYLIQFARANALAAYKASDIQDINASAAIVVHIFREMKLHVEYCKGFGITVQEMEATDELQACTAYSRYVLEIGQSRDWLALQLALAPCLLGYGAIAKMLYNDPKTKKDGNIYWEWIKNYVAEDYVTAVRTGCGETVQL